MKIAMRVLVLTLVLSTAGFSLTSFHGPGAPPQEPPVAAI
jgi:hypothetical protein